MKNPDDFQQAWQSQGRPSIDVALLLNEVRRNERLFTAMIFWRDVREIGVSLILVPVWIYLGIRFSLPWSWYLTVPAVVWIAGFMMMDRMRNHRESDEHDSLRDRVENSLRQVEHQIWLLRNVHWWYLMPVTVSILVFFAHVTWKTQTAFDWISCLTIVGLVAFVLITMGFIYWLNQWAIHSHLKPRYEELESMLAGLKEESGPKD